jgi:hypothetical protein
MRIKLLAIISLLSFFVYYTPAYSQKRFAIDSSPAPHIFPFKMYQNDLLYKADKENFSFYYPAILSYFSGASLKNNRYSLTDSFGAQDVVLRNQHSSLRKKMLRGELIIGSTELLGMGILILLPKKITKWDDNWMQKAKRNFKRSWTLAPIWDKDDWGFNYVGHPGAGYMYYNAVRSQNASVFSSFVFSTVQSTFWEYVVEGIAERPSIQDLIITPVGGIILGEATHKITLRMRRNGFNFFEKAFVLVFNPMYAINNGLRKRQYRQTFR